MGNKQVGEGYIDIIKRRHFKDGESDSFLSRFVRYEECQEQVKLVQRKFCEENYYQSLPA